MSLDNAPASGDQSDDENERGHCERQSGRDCHEHTCRNRPTDASSTITDTDDIVSLRRNPLYPRVSLSSLLIALSTVTLQQRSQEYGHGLLTVGCHPSRFLVPMSRVPS